MNHRILSTSIAVCLFATRLCAQTWDGGGANDNLITAANWNPDAVPSTSADVIFAGNVRLTPNVNSPFQLNSLTFSNTAGAFVFGGLSTLSIKAGGLINNDADTQTFNNLMNFGLAATSTINAASGALVLNNTVTLPTATLTLDGANAISFNGPISGTTAVVKNGSGTFNFAGTATALNADFSFNSGAANLTAGSTQTLSGSGSIAVNGTSTFNVSESLTIDGSLLTRATSAVLNVAAGKTLSLINGGDLAITGQQVFGTNANVNIGGAGSSLTTTGNLTFNGGSTATVSAGGSISIGTSLLSIGTGGNGTVSIDGAASSVSAGPLSLALAGGAGTLNFSNGSAGAFTTLAINNSSFAGTNGTLNILSGATVSATALSLSQSSAANTGTVTIDGVDSALTLAGTLNSFIGGSSASTGTLTVQNLGTFNSNTGLTTVNATGEISILGGTYTSNGNLTLNGGTLSRNGTGIFTMAAGRTLTVQAGGAATFIGAFPSATNPGSGTNVVVTGAGSTLSATGTLILEGGSIVTVQSGGALSGGASLLGTSGSVTMNIDAASFSSPGASQWAGFGHDANVTFSNAATGTVGNLTLGSGSSASTNAAVQVLSGAQVTSGALTATNNAANSASSLTIGGASSKWTITSAFASTVGSATNAHTVTVNTGGTLQVNNSSMTITNLGALVINGGTVEMNALLTATNGGKITATSGGALVLGTSRQLNVNGGGDASFETLNLVNAGSFVSVSGVGSTLTATNLITTSANTINVLNGGTATTQTIVLGAVGLSSMTVGGTGASLTNTGNFRVGRANVSVSNASMQAGTLVIDPDFYTFNNASSTMTVGSSSTVTSSDVSIGTGGQSFGNSSLLRISNGGIFTQNSGSNLTIGGFALGATPSTGELLVEGTGVFTSGTGNILIDASGTLTIEGGTVNLLGSIVAGTGTLDFNFGTLNIVSPFRVGTGGLLGANVNIGSERRFSTTSSTTIDPFRTLTLNGGTFSTASLVNDGTLAFNSGTLSITGAGGFTIGTGGALGAVTTIGTGANFQVTNTLTVASTGSLSVDGGTVAVGALSNSGLVEHVRGGLAISGTATNLTGADFFAAKPLSVGGVFTNQAGARLTLQNGTGRINGAGSLTNAGLITGDGVIAVGVTNTSTGDIRAEAGKTIYFTGAVTPNQGDFILQGGTLDFANAVTNSATGFISGHGALNTGGLTNNGQMAFSGGNTDVRGDVTLTAGARVVTSGAGAVTTFFDDVVHNGLEIFTGAGASTVFFGAQSGAGSFTGTGTVYFIGDLRPGNSPASVLFEGDLVLGGSSSLTLELGGLGLGSQYDHLNVGGSLHADGDLVLALLNGFVPQFGDTFDLLDAGTFSGNFDSIIAPALSGGNEWDFSALKTNGTVTVVPEPGVATLLASALALLGLRRRRVN